jgi:hypothetical protein
MAKSGFVDPAESPLTDWWKRRLGEPDSHFHSVVPPTIEAKAGNSPGNAGNRIPLFCGAKASVILTPPVPRVGAGKARRAPESAA